MAQNEHVPEVPQHLRTQRHIYDKLPWALVLIPATIFALALAILALALQPMVCP